MIFFRTRKSGVCYIDSSKIVGIETYEETVDPYGWFQGSKILLMGGGEIVVQSSPEEVIAAIKAEGLKQIGWYDGEQFCDMETKRLLPSCWQDYTIPVFIKEE